MCKMNLTSALSSHGFRYSWLSALSLSEGPPWSRRWRVLRGTPPWSARVRYDLRTPRGTPRANTCLALSMVVGYGLQRGCCLVAWRHRESAEAVQRRAELVTCVALGGYIRRASPLRAKVASGLASRMPNNSQTSPLTLFPCVSIFAVCLVPLLFSVLCLCFLHPLCMQPGPAPIISMMDRTSKFKRCLAAIFDQTSGDNPPCAWHYNADLFPHVPDFSLEALQSRRQEDFSACRNYTPIAVPSVSFSGMYHVIHIPTTTTTDLNVKYDGCYPEGCIDAYNPALWSDEALSWARGLPQRKPAQEVTDIYLVDSNGHRKYGVTVSQSCNSETVESWDDVILHVTTNQLEAVELHGGSLVRSSSYVCGRCWSWLAGNKCPSWHHAAVGSYPVYSRIRLPLTLSSGGVSNPTTFRFSQLYLGWLCVARYTPIKVSTSILTTRQSTKGCASYHG